MATLHAARAWLIRAEAWVVLEDAAADADPDMARALVEVSVFTIADGHRARYLDCMAAVADHPSSVARAALFAALQNGWVLAAPVETSALACRVIARLDANDPWRAAVPVLCEGARSPASHDAILGARAQLAFASERDVAPAGDQDRMAHQRLVGLVGALSKDRHPNRAAHGVRLGHAQSLGPHAPQPGWMKTTSTGWFAARACGMKSCMKPTRVGQRASMRRPKLAWVALLAALPLPACGTSATRDADDSAADPEPALATPANPDTTEMEAIEPPAIDSPDTRETPIPELDPTDEVEEPLSPLPPAEPVPVAPMGPSPTEPAEPIPAEPVDAPTEEEPIPAGPAPEEPIANPAEPDAVVPEYPAPGEYGELAPLPEANSEMAVAEAGGLIYVLGGYPSSREVQTTVQAYDPVLDEWSLVAPLPVPLHHPVVVGVDGLLFSLGGQLSHDANPDTDRSLLYDPVTDTWSDLAPMPTARGAGAGVEIDGKIYVVGGRPPAGNAFEVYDIESDTWDSLPDLPTTFDERNHLAAAAIDGRVYVAGGRYSGGNFQSPMTASLDIFDPISGTWSLGAELPRPRGGVNGVNAHGCFHVFGGEGSGIGEPNDVFPDHDVYDPGTDSWTSLAPLPVPVHGVTGAVFLNGLIYMPGGGTTSGGSSGSTIFQVYHPTTRCD